MSRWTHADGVDDHPVDPHYNGRLVVWPQNAHPTYWTCNTKVDKATCDRELRLDNAAVPVALKASTKAGGASA